MTNTAIKVIERGTDGSPKSNRSGAILRQSRKLAGDRRGSLTTDFALLFPVLLTVLFATVALYDGLRASYQIQRATATAADLASRSASMTTDLANRIMETATAIAGDYAQPGTFTIIISSVSNPFDVNGDDDYVIDWSLANVDGKMHATADLVDFELPDIADSDSVILVSIDAAYTPELLDDYVGTFRFTEREIRRPRFGQPIAFREP